MAIIKIETKNQSDIGKKPRVWFTCHPEDFEKYFRKICDDLFATHDCAVYYTEDMTEIIAPEDMGTDLGRNNLLIVPVTFKLLTTPNRAMDVDIPYAKQAHIPVLPFMMESGIDVEVNRAYALELEEKVYALCCKVLGEAHPTTVQARRNMEIARQKARRERWLPKFLRKKRK
jgi:hypothetical protein